MSKPKDFSRRDMLAGLGAALGTAALGGCAIDGNETGGQLGLDDPGRSDRSPGPERSPSRTDERAGPPIEQIDPRGQCAQGTDLSAEELLAHIETVVVLCMENRSFDHYLGSLSLLEGRDDVVGLDGTESNLNRDGVPIGVHLFNDFTPEDPPHSWNAARKQWNNGLNDGFVRTHAGPDESDVMGYHVRDQLSVLYSLADGGAVCNHWYSSVMGPTWPNRFYLHGADAHGRKSNVPIFWGYDSIFEILDDAGISNLNYYHDVAFASAGYFKLSGLKGIERFFDHAEAGTLPQFCMIDPHYFGWGANDDHPSHDIRLGQALISSIFSALSQSPQWDRCLFVLTYDEHGGFFDHVPPPTTVDRRSDFRQLGFRVPSVVAGPTVRRGCGIDTTFEHTSVISTLTRRFGLEVLNDRVEATADLSSCIDPALIDNPQPPPPLPTLDISKRAIASREVAPGTHVEMAEALAARPIPAHLDRRNRGPEITRMWLERAEKLGAVRLID